MPGVDKVGPKTAVKWLDEYTSLENLIKNSEALSGKVGENLRSSIDTLKLAHELVTIKKDVELPIGIEELKVGKEDSEGLAKIYEELEFKAWLQGEPQKQTEKQKQFNAKYKLINTEKDLDKVIKEANKSNVIAIDTETTGLSLIHI